jgi:predicted CoA-binding protein
MMRGSVASINVSSKKGESKIPVGEKQILRPGLGIVGDVHAGTPAREVSLLPLEALQGVPFGGYGENIDTEKLDILGLEEGTVLKIGDGVRIKITQRGKFCPSRCSIYYKLGKCIMQEQGVFAVVLEGGKISVGEPIEVEEDDGYAEDKEWILKNCKRIAVVGASQNSERPSNWIGKFLLDRGYEVIPIRPGVKEILGQRCYGSLKEVPGTIDLILIFRRADEVLPVIEEAIEKRAVAVWMQEGIVSPEAFQKAKEYELRAVMDRCIYKELKRR